ncbi:hypothetical protein BJ878DRAFT_527477 [Calycina marina]|uniref:Adenine deaminase n=1 Tax=Calycina marina TaxID=1763456 RepID=A0A9P7YV18_9HELO|nr:hypothetical protein BJ878DRAFT_527477 [Calycina marina]
MCNGGLHSFLVTLPKCEHHLHIEGTLSPEALFDLAKRNNIKLSQDDAAFASPATLLERYAKFSSLDDFLHYYFKAMEVLLTEPDFETLAMNYFETAKKDGVVHAEVFFDPDAHTKRGISYETVVAGLRKGCERAQKELGISSVLIVCVLRNHSVSDAKSVLEVAMKAGHFSNGTLGGLGMSGSEKVGKPEDWEEVFTTAKNAKIHRTAHAGEEGPPEYISTALGRLHTERIDHGRTLAEDPELMKEVATKQILVTLCPLSNICLRGIKQMSEMPIRKFIDAKVHFSINSDDPAYFGGYILANYCSVQEEFNLSLGEWEDIAEHAIQGSWCSAERKRELKNLVYKHSMKFRSSRPMPARR